MYVHMQKLWTKLTLGFSLFPLKIECQIYLFLFVPPHLFSLYQAGLNGKTLEQPVRKRILHYWNIAYYYYEWSCGEAGVGNNFIRDTTTATRDSGYCRIALIPYIRRKGSCESERVSCIKEQKRGRRMIWFEIWSLPHFPNDRSCSSQQNDEWREK